MRDALPNASFIGFTGTPIEKTDANTRAVFGDYISIYDIQRAVADKATVPIYYESRIAKLALNAAELPKIDEEFDEITEGEETDEEGEAQDQMGRAGGAGGRPETHRAHRRRPGGAFREAAGGDGRQGDDRLHEPAHLRGPLQGAYQAAPRLGQRQGRRHRGREGQGCVVKVVMTGSAEDGPDWQPHIRNKDKRRKLANRFKDSEDPFRIVIVRDMWLTGFDAPCLHTMYADKPMRGHGLMQAIARVNRVFRDKPGGLVVDYLGLADQLKQALATYTESGGKGEPDLSTRAQAIAVMLEKHGIACDMLHGFDWDEVDDRQAGRATCAHPGRAGAHSRAGGRQEAFRAGGDGAFARLRPLRRERRGRRRSATTSPSSRPSQAALNKQSGDEPEDRRSKSTRPSASSSRRPSPPMAR